MKINMHIWANKRKNIMNIRFTPVAEDKPDVAWPKEDDASFQDFCIRIRMEENFLISISE